MNKKTFKQYIPTFFIALIFCGLLMVVRHSAGEYFFTSGMKRSGAEFSIFLYKGFTFYLTNYLLDWLFLLCFAIGFVVLFFLIDLVTGKVKTKSKQFREMETERFNKFVDEIGKELNQVKAFNVEDFRHFRENDKLQDCLKKLYDIYLYGESDNRNYFLVLRKFEKGTVERQAIEYLVTFCEDLRNKNKEDIEKFVQEKMEFEKLEKEAQEKKKNKKRKK